MSELENYEAIEMTAEEMAEVAGGAYKKPAAKKGFRIYKILPGDTLYKIGRAHHCTVNDLLLWNPDITDRNLIRAGKYLYIKR